MLAGWLLAFVIILLFAWVVLLVMQAKKAIGESPVRHGFRRLTALAALVLSPIAVAALLALHLTWVSPSVSQALGEKTVSILSVLIFWLAVLGMIFGGAGFGRRRWIAFATSTIVLVWWLALGMTAAISMGAVLARHSTRYLIPRGYTGWISVVHTRAAPPLPVTGGMYVCRIPPAGVVRTSTPSEKGWAKDEYFYYGSDGNLEPLRRTGWGGGGMVWGGSTEVTQGSDDLTETVFIGTEQQFQHAPPVPDR